MRMLGYPLGTSTDANAPASAANASINHIQFLVQCRPDSGQPRRSSLLVSPSLFRTSSQAQAQPTSHPSLESRPESKHTSSANSGKGLEMNLIVGLPGTEKGPSVSREAQNFER
jgi:hypothetical protein